MGGKREIERCRKYFSTLNDNQFQLWLFIVVVIGCDGLPNRNIRHLNVFCSHMANVLKAKLSNGTEKKRVFCICPVFLLFCSVVYFRLLHSSLVAVVVTVVLLCKIRYLNEMLIPLQNNNNIGYVHCTKVSTLSLLILIANNLLSLCSSPTMC